MMPRLYFLLGIAVTKPLQGFYLLQGSDSGRGVCQESWLLTQKELPKLCKAKVMKNLSGKK